VKVRFLADADLNKIIVSGILRREPSVDFLTAHAAGLRGMNDPEVIVLAASMNCSSFGWRREHRSGKTGSYGCLSDDHRRTRYGRQTARTGAKGYR
jgi:hypothetical protein